MIQNFTSNNLDEYPKILFEDKDLAIICKPPYTVVNKSATSTGMTIQEWWQGELFEQFQKKLWTVGKSEWLSQVPSDFVETYGNPEEIYNERSGIVHRLDKDTSGVLLLAKHPGSLVNLLSQFKKREVQKSYLALVHGFLRVDEMVLNYPITRNIRMRRRMIVHPDGREALTRYQVLRHYIIPNPKLNREEQRLTLVRCWPFTGRMHQIRVHFAHIRHPIVSDIIYSGRKRVRSDKEWCPRHFLHASQLSFLHPRLGQKMTFEASLSDDLQLVLDVLQVVSGQD